MSKLSELSNHVVKGYAGGRPPELRLHPDAKSFNMGFPIIMKDVQNDSLWLKRQPRNFDDYPAHVLDILNSNLIKAIKKVGDTQNRKTNVKADMTDWFMHKKYKEFKELSIHAEAIADQMTEEHIATFNFDCWGAVYRKGDETVIHSHWGNLWSWCYYLKIPNDSPPFRFEDTFQSGTNDVTSFDIYPEDDDILIFPSWFKHSVPKMECDGERIMIAGNIQIIPKRVASLPMQDT